MRTRIALLVAGVLALSLAVSGSAGAGSWSIDGDINKTSLVLGQKFRIDVHTSPSEPGRTVQLQERKSGTWQVIKTRQLDASSNAVFIHEPESRGMHKYRVVLPPTQSAPSLLAGPWDVNVREWVNLDTLTPVPSSDAVKKTVKINDVRYPHSFQFEHCDGSKTWTFDLNGRFDQIRGRIGVIDSGTWTKQISMKLDGSSFGPSGIYDPGESQSFSLVLPDGADKFAITMFGNCGPSDTYGALARPQVLR